MNTSSQNRLIGEEAREFVDRDYDAIPTDSLPIWERPKALRVLGKECDSFVRLGAGLTAWIVGAAGGAALAAVVWSGAPIWVRGIALIVAIPLLLGGALLGRMVWQEGRRVVDAFCWWTLLPERMPAGGSGVEDWRAAPVRDAVEARVFIFQGWRPLRIVLCAMSFLAPFVFLRAMQPGSRFHSTWQQSQEASITVFVLILAVVGISAGVVTFGGQHRANRAHSERDPIQRRLLRRDR